MSKKEKIILIVCMVLGLSIMVVMISFGNKNKIERRKSEIEEFVNNEEYGEVIDLFYEIEKMEKDFGLTQNECFAVIDYFEALQAYKNKNYEITYEKLKALSPKNTWIFKKEAEKFKREFLNSEKAKVIARRLKEEEKRNEELNKFREETNKWREENISQIGPYIGMAESNINNTMLGKYNENKVEEKDYTFETGDYEKIYIWKDNKGYEICKAVVTKYKDNDYAVVEYVEFLGENWEKELLYNGKDDELKEEFTIGRYKGKLYKDKNLENNYIENKSDEDMIEEYANEYDVYEYSDADEFYYDHQDDFEGYEDIRHMCINVPKYGNDIDEVDMLTSKALQDCAEYCATLKCGRAGNYSSAGVQPTQTNVAMGEMCWALPSGRKALTPLADTLSAEQHMDVNGPLAALHSYGKINHSACTNGTILNMWISKSDLVVE